MNAAANNERIKHITETEENQKMICGMVIDSYQDMLDGKGRNYKTFFAELESRYKNAHE